MPKADAEKTGIVRHPEGAHGKIFLFRKNLNDGRRGGRQPVFLGQAFVGALQQVERAIAVNRSLVPAHAEDEILIGHRLKLAEGLAQPDEVVSRHVVAVALIHLFGQLPAFLLVAQPEQILGKLDSGGKILRVKFQSLPLKGRTFGKAILLRQFFPDQMVHFRVCFPELESRFARFALAVRVIAQMREHGAVSPGLRLPRIYAQGTVEHLLDDAVVFRVDAVVGQQQQAGNVIGVVTQRGFEFLQHFRAVARLKGAGQAKMRVGVFGEFFQRFTVDLGCERKIPFVEGEFTAGQVGVAEIRVGLLRVVEEILQHQFGFGAQQEGGLAQRDHRRHVVASPVERAETVDFLQQRPRAVRIAVGGQHFDAEHAQTDAESVARQRAGERGVGLRITAHRQQRLHQQHRPFFIADLVTNRLFCGANAVGVIAAEKHLAALLQISRGGGADEQKEAEGDKPAEGWRRSECFIAAKHDDIYAKPLNDASFALEK